jgi:hypothetical protein
MVEVVSEGVGGSVGWSFGQEDATVAIQAPARSGQAVRREGTIGPVG